MTYAKWTQWQQLLKVYRTPFNLRLKAPTYAWKSTTQVVAAKNDAGYCIERNCRGVGLTDLRLPINTIILGRP